MKRVRVNRFEPGRGEQGVSLLEILVVVAMLGIAVMFLLPGLIAWAHQNRLNGFARETSMMMQKSRLEAIRRNVPVVVMVDFASNEIRSFADVTNDDGEPGSDLIFNPIDDAVPGTTDYTVAPTISLTGDAMFIGEEETEPNGTNAVDGFTEAADEGLPRVAVFQPDGSVRNRGAFRIGDRSGNILEVRVSPEATGKVQIRKYQPEREANIDGTYYFQPSNGDERWVWY